jgi:hypothetical protein
MENVIRFPKLPQALRRKSKTSAPATAPQSAPRTGKSAAFRDATRRRLRAIIAYALEILDRLDQGREA